MSAKSLIIFGKTLQKPQERVYYKTRLKNRVTVESARDYIFVRVLYKHCVTVIGGVNIEFVMVVMGEKIEP